MFAADLIRQPGVRFAYPRDPGDAMFIELAIAGRATHIVSSDLDLLALRRGSNDASKRFRERAPRVEVMTPAEFVAGYGHELAIP